MSFLLRKSKLCSSGCEVFVTVSNPQNKCMGCLFKEFSAFIDEEEKSNGVFEHRSFNHLLCKNLKL